MKKLDKKMEEQLNLIKFGENLIWQIAKILKFAGIKFGGCRKFLNLVGIPPNFLPAKISFPKVLKKTFPSFQIYFIQNLR